MSLSCLFDESLPRMIEVLAQKLDVDCLTQGVILRDASGVLSFYVNKHLSPQLVETLKTSLVQQLGHYARPGTLVFDQSALDIELVLEDPSIRTIQITVDDVLHSIRYIDQRIVGSDWLAIPAPVQGTPLRLAFASFKGGVGRSTALSVVARELAQRGKDVLVIDLDLEAPGVGSLLLAEMPRLGTLDYLVERSFGPIAAEILEDMVGGSTTHTGPGLVRVVPVCGTLTARSPENFLAKLSLAMTESLAEPGEGLSLSGKIRALVEDLEARRPYAAVLIDVRAGLAELTAGPLLSLGAQILLFGTAQEQTLQGVKFLLAALRGVTPGEDRGRWNALKMVHAKALIAASHEKFADDLHGLFSDYVYEEQTGLEGFNYSPDDPDAPHYPIPIPLDLAFADWDPVGNPAQLMPTYYARTFGDLIEYVDELMQENEGKSDHPR